MRNPYTDQSIFIKNIYRKINIDKQEIPIINKFYSELKEKMQPTIDYVEPQKQLSINEMRNNIISDLRQYLNNPSEFVESLTNNDEIELFYNFYKMFLKQIEGIKRIDNKYMSQLWNDFKNKLNINFSKQVNTPSYLTASQYEKALKNADTNYEYLPSNFDLKEIITKNDKNLKSTDKKLLSQIKQKIKQRKELSDMSNEDINIPSKYDLIPNLEKIIIKDKPGFIKNREKADQLFKLQLVHLQNKYVKRNPQYDRR